MTINIKRAYEPPAKTDGFRVLVDRLWPRGLKKADARFDSWPKEIAPSTALRKWFNHEPGKWSAFEWRYKKELKENEALTTFREQIENHKTITLLYAAKNERYNHAIVLKSFIEEK